jgi:hypothetical protein
MGLDLTGLGSAFDFAKGILDRVLPEKATEPEKMAALAALTEGIERRDVDRDAYRRDIMVAELQSADTYTSRTRPLLIRCGLWFIGMVLAFRIVAKAVGIYALATGKIDSTQAAIIQAQFDSLASVDLPPGFWYAWGGATSIYAIGRTVEKFGAGGAAGTIAGMITGRGKKG